MGNHVCSLNILSIHKSIHKCPIGFSYTCFSIEFHRSIDRMESLKKEKKKKERKKEKKICHLSFFPNYSRIRASLPCYFHNFIAFSIRLLHNLYIFAASKPSTRMKHFEGNHVRASAWIYFLLTLC